MTISIPYRCKPCMKDGACGYHGILAFEFEGRRTVPTCDHHKKPGKPCHDKVVRMVPVHD